MGKMQKILLSFPFLYLDIHGMNVKLNTVREPVIRSFFH